MAVISRIALLLGITWVMGLTKPLFAVAGVAFSGKQLILLLGGLFLIAKSTFEIHDKLEGDEAARRRRAPPRPRWRAWSCRSCSSTSCSRSTR